jgi:8-oxo-dGTP diphosphatase
MTHQKYSVGFLFNDDQVVLIKKNRPDWQKGKLNGVGGHVEQGETFEQCIEREFEEETGVRVTGWNQFVTMDFPEAEIAFFTKYDPDASYAVVTMTDETVHRIEVYDLENYNVIDNLKWLVPFAQQSHKYDRVVLKSRGDA